MNDNLHPYDDHAELSILGSMMIDPIVIPEIAALLNADDFYLKQHQWIYQAIINTWDEGRGALDIVTIAAALEKMGKSSIPSQMISILSETPTALHARYYAEIVLEKSIRRKLISSASELVKQAWNPQVDLMQLLNGWNQLGEVIQFNASIGESSTKEAAIACIDRISEWARNPLVPGETRYMPTGLLALDRVMGGMEPGLYILAGRPSMGKTSVGLHIAAHVAELGYRIALFTLEMSAQQLLNRLACQRASVDLSKLKRGVGEHDASLATPQDHYKVMDQLVTISEWPLDIYDQSSLTPLDVQRVLASKKYDLAIIDGLWLMSSIEPQANRHLELSAISRSLKRLDDIPLLVIHQLSRSVELRADKRPVLSDLRESGSIEENADIVWMLYRDGFYHPTSQEANILELWIRKNRLNGPAGVRVRFFWNGRYMRVDELSSPMF